MYKFALIGCGYISKRHIEIINKVGQLKAVCDINPKKANELAENYSVKAYYTIEELLANEKNVDIITICTPNGFHAEHIIKSLQAGKHVLSEKPLCLTSAGAWQIIETEKFCRKKLFVAQSARYNPLLQQLKQLIDTNKVGKLYSFHLSCLWNRQKEYYKDWHGKEFPDGGCLYTQFSHYIDALLWMFGDVENIKGFSSNLAHKDTIEYEDTGVASLLMKNGMNGCVHWSVNSCNKNYEIALTLIAERGTFRIGGEYLDDIQYQETDGSTIDHRSNLNSASHLMDIYEQVLEVLQGGSQPDINSYAGMKTVETIEKIYKAVSSNPTE